MIGLSLVRIQSSLRGGSQTVKASVLYTEDVQVQVLPALQKGRKRNAEETVPAKLAGAASSTAERESFKLTVSGFESLAAHLNASLAQSDSAAVF
jgi:hypothetical protein